MRKRETECSRQPLPSDYDYRVPMNITELYILWNGNSHYICPRCRITLDREFSAYCDRCGQCLNWSQYKKARRIYGK